MLERRIERYITEKKLFGKQDKLVVALSGGADSVALLRALLSLGYDCMAAHCNFHLRADESDRDEAFVRKLCDILSVPLEVVHFQTSDYAKEKGLSIEMAARELRYEWFENIRQKHGASYIAVAHHKDDNVETFLLNLSRGTGINGLKGIMPKNGWIVRPLLEVGRDDILEYLKNIGQDYVTDSTNLEDNSAMERVMVSSDALSIEKLLREVSPQAILFEWLSPLGFNSTQIKDIMRSLKSISGKIFYSNSWTLLRDRDRLLLKNKTVDNEEYKLNVRSFSLESGFEVPKINYIAYIDADKLCGELKLRKWKSGDRFVPFGMKGFKKIRDYLRDRKLSLFEKENVMVVTSGEEIVWVVNERTDNRFRIDSNTKTVVELKVSSSK